MGRSRDEDVLFSLGLAYWTSSRRRQLKDVR